MNDHELEAVLKTLHPRRLPSRLLAVDAHEMPAPAPRRRFALGPGWVGWSCAAIFVAALVASRLVLPPATSLATRGASDASAPSPAPAEQLLVQDGEEDFVRLPDGSPARRVRVRSLDTLVWTDPKTNALVRWTVPREDVRVTPIHVY